MTATTIRVQMAQRKDTAANWTAANPILLSGEIGYETDTKKFKIGNGSTNWNSLAYLPIPDGSGNLTITGNLEIGSTGSLTFEGSTADGFETTLAVTNPTADRTITLPDRSGTVITSGDTGTVTSTMILDGTIVNGDVSASAAIAGTKITPDFGAQTITTTGVVSAAVGAAATPSITFTGDTNTGIYSPGADQVAISTGGSGRLFVDASGRLGIGTSSPNYTLDVAGTINANATVRTSNGTHIGILGSEAFAAGVVGVGSTSNHPLVLGTNSLERLRITSAGLVGIGTSSPDVLLDAQAISGNAKIQVRETTTSKRIQLEANAAYHALYADGAVPIYHYSNGSIALTIDSSQRVGIGTTSPSYLLDVASSVAQVGNSTDAFIQYKSTAGNWHVGANSSNAYVFYSGTYGSGTERARIDSSGRLLVGTSTGPSDSTLVLQGNSSNSTYNSVLRMLRNVTNPAADAVLGSIIFGVGNAASSGIECYTDGQWGTNDYPGRLVFSTTADGASSPTERMKITQSGEIYVRCGSGSWNFIANNASTAGTVSALYSGRYSVTDNTGTTGTQSYVVWTNGNVQNTNNSYTAISDIKLKENVVDANSQWADIKSLQVRNYNLKEGQTHRQIGLIAQEVELISPGLVYESPDRDDDGNDLGTVTKSVNYSVLYMKAVKALQEAMERIETLEAKVAALESA